MTDGAAPIAAAIDVGSNSVHLLVAREVDGALEMLIDESELIGLGDVVDAGGRVTSEAQAAVVAALNVFGAKARAAGAGPLIVLGTEPLRRAQNAPEIERAVAAEAGLTLRVISERQEAELTFLGVTAARPPGHSLAVVDIGGGSTEVSLHVPGHVLRVVPLGVGSGRLTNAIVSHDPPTTEELDLLARAAREAVAWAEWPLEGGSAQAIANAVFVGGTATNVARMGRLDRSHLGEDLQTLALLKADEVVEHFGVRPRRARQLAAGVAIISALLDRFALDEADVSEASLRDGAIIAALRFGNEWLEGLDTLLA